MKRLVLALTVLALAPSAAGATTPALDYKCSPGPNDCNAWYRTPVKIMWDWNNGLAQETGGNCADQTFTADTKGTKVSCEVSERDPPFDSVIRNATIRVDRTAPSITGPGLGRPPDRNDWFNHPVAFQFTGQDATSGIDSCTGGTYGGSDGAGVSIFGSCRDVAGNVTSGAFALNYDATPPPKPTVAVLPGDRRVAIRWSSEQNEAEIVRIGKASSQAVVYRGVTEKFTDRQLRNGRRYRYLVTLIDQAGNRSSTTMSAVPTDSPLLLPANGAHLRSAPMLAWKRVKHAHYYNAQLLRNNRKILSRWPRTTHLQLHERWRFQGRLHRLVRGHYCWHVWPGFGPRSKQNYGRVLGKSCFTVTR